MTGEMGQGAVKRLRKVLRRGRGKGFDSGEAFYEAFDAAISDVESSTMELPKDACGAPIHVGDAVSVERGEMFEDGRAEVLGVAVDRVFLETSLGRIVVCLSSRCKVSDAEDYENVVDEFAAYLWNRRFKGTKGDRETVLAYVDRLSKSMENLRSQP